MRVSLVDTLPDRLSPSDRLKTLNASQEVWATILDVRLAPDGKWVYLEVESAYVPDPYYIKLLANSPVRAQKHTPWRKTKPSLVERKVAKSALLVKTAPRARKEPRPVYPELTWEEERARKRARWIPNDDTPRERRRLDNDIEFIPDPDLELERRKKEPRRKKRRRTYAPKRKQPTLLPHYETLGCKVGQRWSTIKRAFKKLARQHHPDMNPNDPGAELRFKAINNAYQALSKALEK